MSKMEELVKDMNKGFKATIVSKGLPKYDYDRIPFTSPRLNYMTFGGLPVGKLIEFYGENHGGKTTTALDSLANYQHMPNAKDAVYVDIENTFDTVWATKLGVDVDNLWILKPESQGAETIFEQLIKMLETGEVGFMVIDSLGALMSNQELEGSIEDKSYGGIAMGLTKFTKKAEMLCNKYNATIIGINQERAKIGSMYGEMKTTGGEAWKYQCSVRLEFRMGKYFDSQGRDLTRQAENPSGNYVLVTMKKNKTCPPTRRTGFYTLNYLKGIDYLTDLIEVSLKYGIIEQAGAWYSIKNTETGEQIVKLQGQPRVYEYLEDEENISTLKMIEDYLDKKIQED